MPRFLVIGQIQTDHTFNVDIEAKDMDEAETLAIAMAKGQAPGLVTIHRDSVDIVVCNISVSQEDEDDD